VTNLTGGVVVVCLLCGVVMFILGVMDVRSAVAAEAKLRQAAESAAVKAATPAQPGSLEPHSGIDLGGALEGLAKLAGALKDLDRSGRSFVLSLAFVAVAALVVSVWSL
jgi:hypothetical protein